MKTYEQVHAGLFWARGKASWHQCSCGKVAEHWAYLHNAGEAELRSPRGSAYSEDFEHYAPMCNSCHRKFDLANSPEQVAAFKLVGMKSPVDREKHRLSSSAGGKIGGVAVMKMRRKCGECEMTSHPAGIAIHQRASGHIGWSSLE